MASTSTDVPCDRSDVSVTASTEGADSNVLVKLTHPVEAPSGVVNARADVVTAPQLYYQTHNGVTYKEYHVVPSTTTLGRYWVMNVLDLIMCVHDDVTTATQCAEGIRCTKNGPGSGRRH